MVVEAIIEELEAKRTLLRALEAIVVEYEVLDPVTDPFEAMSEDAPLLHPGGNVLSVSRISRGDVDAALASRRITQPQLLDIARRIRRPREHAGHQAGEQRASQPSQQPLPDV